MNYTQLFLLIENIYNILPTSYICRQIQKYEVNKNKELGCGKDWKLRHTVL